MFSTGYKGEKVGVTVTEEQRLDSIPQDDTTTHIATICAMKPPWKMLSFKRFEFQLNCRTSGLRFRVFQEY